MAGSAHVSSLNNVLHAILRLWLAVAAAAYLRDLLHALVDLHLVDMADCFVLLTAGMNISRCLYICIACDVCALAGSLRMK